MSELLDKESYGEYEEFLKNCPCSDFLQSSVWAGVKKEWGSNVIVSRDESGKIRAGMMVLSRKLPAVPYTLLYAPRGPICEPSEYHRIKDLTDGIKALAKKKRACFFKSDPAILATDEEFRKTVTAIGYNICDTGKNFEGIQPKFISKIDIKGKTLDEIAAGFHHKTRYNIRLSERKGVTVRLGSREDLPEFNRLMIVTGKRDKFVARPLSYFERMYDVLVPKKMMRIYVAEAEGKAIASTIAIHLGNRVVYLYGASDDVNRNLMPNYLLQWNMMHWAVEEKCDIYDFRGISGDPDPENPLYGLYRFKKGFGGETVEYIGEIVMVFKPFINWGVNVMLDFRKRMKGKTKHDSNQ